MSETKTKIQPFQIDYVCNECGEGRMRPTGLALLSHPPKYPHVCDKCGKERIFRESYPKIVYEEV